MPKDKPARKAVSLRHNPLAEQTTAVHGKLSKPKPNTNQRNGGARTAGNEDEEDEDWEEETAIPSNLGAKIFMQARAQVREDEMADTGFGSTASLLKKSTVLARGQGKSEPTRTQPRGGAAARDEDDDEEDWADMDEDDDQLEEDEDQGDQFVEFDGDEVRGTGLSESEEMVVQRFLSAGSSDSRSLADIIMEKIREKSEQSAMQLTATADEEDAPEPLPPKVVEVYTSVGKMLHHYKSGKLPRALKMMPHLKNWEEVLWLTRPDEWSACATYACTRIFASNLNAKMAQRFYNIVLLEKCRDDIKSNKTLNYHLYMALKKALFKPAAFYKGILLPLCQSQTCTLREATIIGSVLAKVSIPANHSAAALLKLAEMRYSGSNSVFLRILMNKKYALPRRCIDSLVNHFTTFESETRELPVIWHQALLVFAQRYKLSIDEEQRERLKQLLRVCQHHQITPEIRRELFGAGGHASSAMHV